MITGPPGSGKTTTAIVLVLALLERRRPDGPVPVMVSMAAWDPARQPFEDWLAELIAEKYGLPSEVARDLVGRRRIIPILDGFDELPVEKAGWALRRINSAVRVDDPLVIVARDGSLGRAVGSRQGEPLRRALVLRLMPVPFPRVVHYLESLLPQVDYPGWNRWREELGRDGALAQALSLPANIKVVRSAYLDDRRPLPDFGSLNASGVAERLLSDWIDRLYPRNGRERSWLGEIARRSGDGVPGDFSWWLLRRRLPRWALALPVGVLDLLVGGVLLAGCFGTSTPNVIAASIWGVTWSAALLVAGGFAQFAVRMPVWKTTEPVVQFRHSLVFRMAFAALVGVTGGLAIGSGVTDARVENGVFLGAGVAFNILSASSVGLYALSVVIFAVRGGCPGGRCRSWKRRGSRVWCGWWVGPTSSGIGRFRTCSPRVVRIPIVSSGTPRQGRHRALGLVLWRGVSGLMRSLGRRFWWRCSASRRCCGGSISGSGAVAGAASGAGRGVDR